ncbi:MAG TPA: HAD family hydrolase, partial [Blastocatellia bacterium]
MNARKKLQPREICKPRDARVRLPVITMPIKLLALDIDGTLLTPQGAITPRNSAAINHARQFGVQVVLVTGRRFNSARELAQQLDMGASLISHNGALTKNVDTMETLDYHPL